MCTCVASTGFKGLSLVVMIKYEYYIPRHLSPAHFFLSCSLFPVASAWVSWNDGETKSNARSSVGLPGRSGIDRGRIAGSLRYLLVGRWAKGKKGSFLAPSHGGELTAIWKMLKNFPSCGTREREREKRAQVVGLQLVSILSDWVVESNVRRGLNHVEFFTRFNDARKKRMARSWNMTDW